jgi:hypothetical protein
LSAAEPIEQRRLVRGEHPPDDPPRDFLCGANVKLVRFDERAGEAVDHAVRCASTMPRLPSRMRTRRRPSS